MLMRCEARFMELLNWNLDVCPKTFKRRRQGALAKPQLEIECPQDFSPPLQSCRVTRHGLFGSSDPRWGRSFSHGCQVPEPPFFNSSRHSRERHFWQVVAFCSLQEQIMQHIQCAGRSQIHDCPISALGWQDRHRHRAKQLLRSAVDR